MDTQPRSQIVLLIVGALALTVAIGSISLAAAVGDPIGLVFDLQFTGLVVLGTLAWAVAALAARRVIVGKFTNASAFSRALFLWVGSRVVLLVAVVLDLVIWLVSAAIGLEMQDASFHGLVLLTVLSAFLGIAGGAVRNSIVTLRHLRRV